MGKSASAGVKIDRYIEAEPVIVAGKRIQPVARIVGWEMDSDEESSPFISRVGRVTPVEVRVDDSGGDDGESQAIIAIDDPSQEPIRGILAASAALSAVCILIMLIARVAIRRK